MKYSCVFQDSAIFYGDPSDATKLILGRALQLSKESGRCFGAKGQLPAENDVFRYWRTQDNVHIRLQHLHNLLTGNGISYALRLGGQATFHNLIPANKIIAAAFTLSGKPTKSQFAAAGGVSTPHFMRLWRGETPNPTLETFLSLLHGNDVAYHFYIARGALPNPQPVNDVQPSLRPSIG